MRKSITITERKSKLFFRAKSQLSTGAWIGVGDCIVLKSNATATQVGEATQQGLALSGTLDPDEHGGIEPVLKAAGVSSLATFDRGSKAVSVAAEGDEITVTPTDRSGSSYFPANEEALRIPSNCDANLLGETVLRALANSS
jgi:hypothetical protein